MNDTTLPSIQPCSCSAHSSSSNRQEQIKAFYQLRDRCPALRLTISDEILVQHKAFTKSEPDSAFHCSIPFKAYCQNNLADFTKSLHRFAVNEEGIRQEVTRQYKQDLRETWVLESDESSRFRKARNYQGRLAELNLAWWLENQGWTISNLEMYGGQFDVEAFNREQINTAFEIKFLAEREVVFELVRDSFLNPTAGHIGAYSPADYLIFRLYEAAKQLTTSSSRRIAVAIVSDYDLSYKIPLKEGWIDWKAPRFLERDSEIYAFLENKRRENYNLDNNLQNYINELNEIWILQYRDGFELSLEHRFLISETQDQSG